MTHAATIAATFLVALAAIYLPTKLRSKDAE